MRFPIFGDCLGHGCFPLTFGLPFFGQLFLTCVQATPGNWSSRVRAGYEICGWWWRLPLPPLFFRFFFLLGRSLSVVISSRSGLFSFSLSKISTPLVFALTGWKCQMAPLGTGRNTVARHKFKHFINPRLLRRTTPAGMFPVGVSESQPGMSHSLTKTSPLFSPVVSIHLYTSRVFVWVATNNMTHLWFFFKKKNKNKTNVSKNNFMTIIKIFIASLCK